MDEISLVGGGTRTHCETREIRALLYSPPLSAIRARFCNFWLKGPARNRSGWSDIKDNAQISLYLAFAVRATLKLLSSLSSLQQLCKAGQYTGVSCCKSGDVHAKSIFTLTLSRHSFDCSFKMICACSTLFASAKPLCREDMLLPFQSLHVPSCNFLLKFCNFLDHKCSRAVVAFLLFLLSYSARMSDSARQQYWVTLGNDCRTTNKKEWCVCGPTWMHSYCISVMLHNLPTKKPKNKNPTVLKHEV